MTTIAANPLDITGNTYAVRDRLREIGCRWDAGRKRWVAPNAEVAAQARAMVKPGNGGARRSPRTCKTCGCRINYGAYCGKCEYR